MKELSARVRAVGFSASVSLAQKVREDKARGAALFDFTVGEPHWGPPEVAVAAVKDALDRGLTRYSDARGLPALRERLAEALAARGVPATAATLLLTPGGKQAIFMACQALLDPGDEAILVPPCWVSYADIVKLAGGVPVEAPTAPAGRYRPDMAALEAAVSPRTKLIVLNNPGNPTGAVWEPEVIAEVARFAQRHDLWILDDLVYDAFNYTGRPVAAIGATGEGRDRTVTVGSFSKAFAMTGFRVGYVHAPAALDKELLKLQQQTVTCLPAFAQAGALAALEQAADYPERMAAHYAGLRQVLLESLGGIDAGPLEGAFYAFVDIGATGMDAAAFAERLYREHAVAVVPGSAFGAAGEGRVRVSYATDAEALRAGMGRLAGAIRAWSR